MVSRGPPALTASHLGDSSNTKLLSARTNIWESVMKGLGEQEGESQNPENSHRLQKHNRKWRRLWEGKRGSQDCGMWGGHPHAWAPFTQPQAAQGGLGERGQELSPGAAPLHRKTSDC